MMLTSTARCVAIHSPLGRGSGSSRRCGAKGSRGGRTPVARCAASSSESPPRLPRSTQEQAAQAAAAVKRAALAGKSSVAVEFQLPLIGATDLDDWPGGVRQQYQAVAPMVGDFLKGIVVDGRLDIKQRVVEDGDAVVVLSSGDADAMVFLTAETLPELKSLAAEKKSGVLAIVNSQIRNDDGSNFISDLGIGPWKKRNEEFLSRFEQVYWLSEQRIKGETIRLLKAYPHPWQLYVLTDMSDSSAQPECIQVYAEKPSYKELEALLISRPGSVAAMDIFERVKREGQFNASSLSKPPNNIDQK